jgi:hypothetical protein
MKNNYLKINNYALLMIKNNFVYVLFKYYLILFSTYFLYFIFLKIT